jgi:hypothetical protein
MADRIERRKAQICSAVFGIGKIAALRLASSGAAWDVPCRSQLPPATAAPSGPPLARALRVLIFNTG